MSTYEGYAKEYYHKNKDRIRERTRAYRKKYNKKYYKENKHEILLKLSIKRKKTRLAEVLENTGK